LGRDPHINRRRYRAALAGPEAKKNPNGLESWMVNGQAPCVGIGRERMATLIREIKQVNVYPLPAEK
jgi:hypothetical protein